MLSKNKIKYIQNLYQKKQRDLEHVFLAEGDKITKAIIAQKPNWIISIYATTQWLNNNQNSLKNIETTEITEEELKKISCLQTPNQVVSIVKMQSQTQQFNPQNDWVIALDGIQDPGNLGTIIRLADWYGISQIVCSQNTVDCYNPKVIQSTMGSFLQVNVTYTDMEKYLEQNKKCPIYAALLAGKDVITVKPKNQNGIILIGNEGKGIADNLIKLCNSPITIKGKGNAESLNAAIATGIILSHLVR